MELIIADNNESSKNMQKLMKVLISKEEYSDSEFLE